MRAQLIFDSKVVLSSFVLDVLQFGQILRLSQGSKLENDVISFDLGQQTLQNNWPKSMTYW